jgi:hypothetical protein
MRDTAFELLSHYILRRDHQNRTAEPQNWITVEQPQLFAEEMRAASKSLRELAKAGDAFKPTTCFFWGISFLTVRFFIFNP